MGYISVKNGMIFKELIKKRRTYRLSLNGGVFTKYTIWPYRGKQKKLKDGRHFRVKSHFCDTVETCNFKCIMDEKMYHFKEGIEKGALYVEV